MFSETEWVEQHGHPRLQYLEQSLRGRWGQVLTAVFTVVGGAIGLALLVDRVVATFQYLYPYARHDVEDYPPTSCPRPIQVRLLSAREFTLGLERAPVLAHRFAGKMFSAV